MYTRQQQFGFTIVEVMISVAVFAIIGVGTVLLIGSMFTTGGRLSIVGADTDQGRQTAFRLMQELRNATVSNNGGYPLALASAQELIFYSNIDGGSDIERVRYYINNDRLYRGITKPSGSPFVYNPASETSFVVQNNLANGSDPLFYYYDGSYTGTETPLSYPVNLTQVKLVRMDLKIFNKAGQVGSSSFTITASSTIRSLKTNLGE